MPHALPQECQLRRVASGQPSQSTPTAALHASVFGTCRHSQGLLCAWSGAGGALNALSLVDAPHAWLEDPGEPVGDTGLGEASSSAAAAFLGSPLAGGPYLPSPRSPRSPLPEQFQEVGGKP